MDFLLYSIVKVTLGVYYPPLINRDDRQRLILTIFSDVVFSLFEYQDSNEERQLENAPHGIANWKPSYLLVASLNH